MAQEPTLTLTIRLSLKRYQLLEQLAKELHYSKTGLATERVNSYLDREAEKRGGYTNTET